MFDSKKNLSATQTDIDVVSKKENTSILKKNQSTVKDIIAPGRSRCKLYKSCCYNVF